MQCRSGGRSHWKSCCRITSWFSSHGSVLIALNQEVKSCFHVRHAASTYTLTEDSRGSMQWYQRPRIILNSQCLQVCFPNTHHSTTRHSCWRNVCKTGRFKNHPDSRADSLSAELSVRSWDFPVQNTVELLSERGPKYRRQQ